jgi:hypothetical protein
VKYTPFQKLYDCFIGILAGAQGIVEINDRLRADPALQAAFGRTACAEQSVIQDTLDACTATTVAQMEQALETIFRQHSRAFSHDYVRQWQLLDVDLSGMPCGKKAALATKGYFAEQKNRRGRQLGRVLATHSAEIVVDQLLAGNASLFTALPGLVAAAEHRLGLSPAQRARTILRVDAGGGSVADINGVLARGYQFHGKDCSTQRARSLATRVTTWVPDPRMPERPVGWVEGEAREYVRPVRRLAVRCRKPNGQWGVAVLISTLTPATVLALTPQPPEPAADPESVLLAYAYFYDQRGGGVETSLKEDKQGLGITKRNKRRFAAQQMLVALAALAHNVLVWARGWLEPQAPLLRRYGIERLIRDVFGLTGAVELDDTGRVCCILLNQACRRAHRLLSAFQSLVATTHVVLNLGET